VPCVRQRTYRDTHFPVLLESPLAVSMLPEPRTLCGDSGWDFASVLGSATPAVVRRLGIDMSTKLNCPQCRSIETSRSHRRGAVERYLLAVIGVRPFRCLNCDARFYSFARCDEETSLNNKTA
jgi:hypothetical protein